MDPPFSEERRRRLRASVPTFAQRDKRGLAAGTGLLALLIVVAATSRTRLFQEGEPPVSNRTAHLLVDFAAYLFIATLLLSLALTVWALWPREGYDGPQPQRRSLWQTLLQSLVLVVAMALLVGAIMARRRLGNLKSAASGVSAGSLHAPVVAQAAGSPPPPEFDWAAAGLVLLTFLIVAAVVWRRWRWRRVAAGERRALARELAAVVEDTLDDLRLDDDPRRAVVQAYARMERVLALHGLPRRDAESPREYLLRALIQLPISAAALDRLTDLFEEARFSTHEISPAMRADAVDALAQIRDELTSPERPPVGALRVAG